MHQVLRELRLHRRLRQLMDSATTPNRAGHRAGPFGPHPTAPILARLPLLPSEPADEDGADLLAEGMFLASRQLANPALTDRSRQTARAYELRARHRPTPHGVFAGVALADVTNGPARLHLGTEHRVRTNPSGSWLAAFAATLLEGPNAHAVLNGLKLTTDATAVRRGDRWETEAQTADNQGAIHRHTVRATAATDLIMAQCADPARAGTVVEAVLARWPHAPRATVFDTVADLARRGFLLTDLLPADAGNDPVGHLLSVLPETHPQHYPLVQLRNVLAAADTLRPGSPERRKALGSARDLADTICRVDRPLVVDTAADARIDIPTRLVANVTAAAGVLWRIAPRVDPAAEYHRRFTDRYGRHRHVPLLEAADPVIGIGTDTPPDAGAKAERVPGLAAVLSGLIAQAAAGGDIEVELDEAAITAMTGDEKTQPPHTTEIYIRLVADSQRTDGPQSLRPVVVGAVPTAGSTLARFVSLLGHHHTEPQAGTALIVELAVRPRAVSASTVAVPAGFATHRIPVGVTGAGEHDLSLADLLLVSDGNALMVWSTSLNRQVIPVLYSRLAPALLPPVARLLYVLGQAGTSPWHTWSWDDLAAGPFQPRIRHKTVILSPARWTLPPELIAAAGHADQWAIALDQWRTGTIPPPPAVVVTQDDDRQLPLNLDHDLDRELLRRYVRRGLTAVTETPGGSNTIGAVATGPHGRHLAELVIPLIRHAATPTAHRSAGPTVRVRGAGLFHPGGPWLSLAIPTAPHLQDELLLRVGDLAAGLAQSWDRWFWLRYRTAALGHHLRVRFHGHPEILGSRVLPAVADWAAAMSDANLAGRMVVECYDQEIERYGGTGAIEHAEHVFAVDSRLVLALLDQEADGRIIASALVAAAITQTVADGDLSALTGRRLDRDARQKVNGLRATVRAADGDVPDLGPDGKEPLADLLGRLTAYRDALPPHRRADCASSLIHMHANRALPASGDEPLMRALGADLIARTR
ncbi:lantibiotic dehydratase [Streptosporangium saharense]|uniref:lantibiotic dehydratase n=1 Tax=Streptosporangium saharense TaxID=1706840 RepID=UPI0036AF7236